MQMRRTTRRDGVGRWGAHIAWAARCGSRANGQGPAISSLMGGLPTSHLPSPITSNTLNDLTRLPLQPPLPQFSHSIPATLNTFDCSNMPRSFLPLVFPTHRCLSLKNLLLKWLTSSHPLGLRSKCHFLQEALLVLLPKWVSPLVLCHYTLFD